MAEELGDYFARMRLLFCLLLFGPLLAAQQQPNCTMKGQLGGVGNMSRIFDNRAIHCGSWSLTYYADASATALTVTLSGAPDQNGQPGTWATLLTLTNPSSGNGMVTGFYPWMQVQIVPTPITRRLVSLHCVRHQWRHAVTAQQHFAGDPV